jgi:hypothetical protein
MRLPPSPSHDFKCVYQHSCPYLDWLSTTWVLEEYRRAGEEYQEHLRIIEAFDPALKAQNERVRVLERENAESRRNCGPYTKDNLSRARKTCRIAREFHRPRKKRKSGGPRWDSGLEQAPAGPH